MSLIFALSVPINLHKGEQFKAECSRWIYNTLSPTAPFYQYYKPRALSRL